MVDCLGFSFSFFRSWSRHTTACSVPYLDRSLASILAELNNTLSTTAVQHVFCLLKRSLTTSPSYSLLYASAREHVFVRPDGDSALASSLNAKEVHKGLIYPRIEHVHNASLIVAREVMKAACRDSVSQLPEEQWLEWEEWGDPAIKAHIYDPGL